MPLTIPTPTGDVISYLPEMKTALMAIISAVAPDPLVPKLSYNPIAIDKLLHQTASDNHDAGECAIDGWTLEMGDEENAKQFHIDRLGAGAAADYRIYYVFTVRRYVSIYKQSVAQISEDMLRLAVRLLPEMGLDGAAFDRWLHPSMVDLDGTLYDDHRIWLGPLVFGYSEDVQIYHITG